MTDFPPLPTPEARIQALERLMAIFNARIEQVSIDMDRSFRQSAAYQAQFETKVDARFDSLDDNVAQIRSEMATMKTEILNSFQQLITMMDERLPKPSD